MPQIIPFRSNSPTHQFLSNFFKCAFIFAGTLITLGAEQAYVLSKALLIMPKINQHDRRRQQEIDRILRADSALTCKGISRSIKQNYHHEHKKFEMIQEMVMYSILIQNFSQNQGLQGQLLNTGNAFLVEANPADKIWGCGMSCEQVNHAARRCEALGCQWSPPPNTNLLGKLLMRVRAELQMSRPIARTLFIGDSLARLASLNCAMVTWPGANLEKIMTVADILGTQTLKNIIICAGTNSLPRGTPWEGLPPDSQDGAAQRSNLGEVTEKFRNDLKWFHGNHPNIRLHLIEIPFRWCDPPKWSHVYAPAKTSRLQDAVFEMNQIFSQIAKYSNGQICLVELYYDLFHPENFVTTINRLGESKKGLHFSQRGVEKFTQVVNAYMNKI